MTTRNKLLRWRFLAVAWVSARVAKRPGLAGLSGWLMRRIAVVTVRERALQPREGVRAIAEEWRRAFPKDHPIIEADARTVIAEIPTRCPLRGSGDAHACWRMMAYDRALLGHIGGEFAVLESQAVSGDRCRVAIRARGDTFEDIVQAHERTHSGDRH